MSKPSVSDEESRLPFHAGTSRVREATYERLLDALSAWQRMRHRRDFDSVAAFCLFVGYPRSGHSIVGALLNAHRDAVIAHELNAPPLVLGGLRRDELYARILARAAWFHLRGDRANYSYRVPGQWQGRFSTLRLIGDKRGGFVARCLAAHPDLFVRVRALTGVPLRLVHVVRNPFDNVSAISTWDDRPLDASAEYYFRHCEVTGRLGDFAEASEIHSFRHEDLVADPRRILSGLCAFLGLDLYAGYLDDCCRVLFPHPTRPRRRIAWPDDLRRAVEKRIRTFPHLDGYAFELSNADAATAP